MSCKPEILEINIIILLLMGVLPCITNISSKKILEDRPVLCNSHMQLAVPEIEKRRLGAAATFKEKNIEDDL